MKIFAKLYFLTGIYNVFIKSVREEYQVVKRGWEHPCCGEEYNIGKREAISSAL